MTLNELDCARFEVLARAIERLGAALRQPRNEWTRDGAIQRFEFTFAHGSAHTLCRGQFCPGSCFGLSFAGS